MSSMLKVLIVDDNSLYRRIMTKAVEALPIATEVETAPTGSIALKKIPVFQPDLVLLDIEMPDMNGIEVLKAIRAEYPRLMVVLVSGVNSRSADITIEGLTSGASDFIPKPIGANPGENIAQLKESLGKVFQMLMERRETRKARPALSRPTAPRGIPSLLPTRVEVVGIGISTGGPTALEEMLPLLPANLRAPVVIVQHMPPLFTESLAKALNSRSAVAVSEVRDGQTLEAGQVYLAPGGKHVVVKRAPGGEQTRLVAHLDDGPPVNSCKPAVDVLFQSLASTVGKHALVVVMTGMGQDGRDGAEQVKQQMGYCITQSEETCTVYGMPQAVEQADLADEIVPLGQIAGRIASIAGGLADRAS